MLSAASILPLPKCYSSTIPITKTPLYKYLTKTPKITEPEEQESKKQQIQTERPQEKTKAPTDQTYKHSDKLTYKPVYKSENKLAKKPIYGPVHKSADRRLRTSSVLSALHPNMTLSDAIDVFRDSTEPPLNIIVLWRNLESVDIYRDTPIGIKAVSGTIGQNLEFLLRSVSAGATESIGYGVDHGTIIVATEDFLPKKQITYVHDISDLIGQPANYFTPPRAPMPYYGMTYGGGYGGYGYRGYGMPYGGYRYGETGFYGGRGYGGPFIMGGYRTNVGRIRTGTSLSVNPYIMRSPGYYRGQGLVGLIETHTSRRRP